MGDNVDKIIGRKFRFLGFEFDKKTFFITTGSALGVLVLLIALTLFGVEVSWYGVLFGLGFLVALCLAPQLCKERGISPDFPYTLIWFVFPFSILGARLYYLIFNGGIQSFAEIFRFWEGGLAIYGGVIGGFLGLIIACLIKKVNILDTTDIVVPLLSLGQFFGRIGCIFGGCCYGVEVTNSKLHWFPIALNIDGVYHYATNFYESILNLVLFFVLLTILRKVKIRWLTSFSYLVGYGIVRFVLEHFRATEQTLFVGNYPVSIIVSIACVIIGVVGIITILLVNNLHKKSDAKA